MTNIWLKWKKLLNVRRLISIYLFGLWTLSLWIFVLVLWYALDPGGTLPLYGSGARLSYRRSTEQSAQCLSSHLVLLHREGDLRTEMAVLVMETDRLPLGFKVTARKRERESHDVRESRLVQCRELRMNQMARMVKVLNEMPRWMS